MTTASIIAEMSATTTRTSIDPPVAIVILTYNSAAHIGECLTSLNAMDYANYEIIVVDNGSSDDTLQVVATQHPQVIRISNQANLGYAEGNNVGLRRALDHHVEFVLVLNDDVTVAPDMLRELINAAQMESQSALLGPLVYHHASPQVIQSAGGTQSHDWEFHHRGQNQPDQGEFQATEPVVWLSGCAMLARSDALKHIGLFDSKYFMYWEDVDWCLRTREAGYQVLLVPRAKLWHKGVQLAYDPPPRVTYYMARNELYLLAKHHASLVVQTKVWLKYLRTIISYTVRPKWKNKRAHRNAQVKAMLHVLTRRFGSFAIA